MALGVLIAWPVNTPNNSNNVGVVNAETYVQDGVTYETIYLPGNADSAQTVSLIKSWGSTGNYRYVLQNDWDLVANRAERWMLGTNVIFDFNGHRVSGGYADSKPYYLYSSVTTTLEITDTSATGGGGTHVIMASPPQTLIFSGNGRYELESGSTAAVALVIRGGQAISLVNYSDVGAACYNIVAYPNMRVVPNGTNFINAVPRADYFAVSTTDLVSGAYNYVYALDWELSGTELNSLQIPAGKTYYLWGRNQNGQYKYLGLRYTDGAWR